MKNRDLYNADYILLSNLFKNRLENNPNYCPTIQELISDCGMGRIKKKQLIDWLEYNKHNYSK